jgi:hypothetical protein
MIEEMTETEGMIETEEMREIEEMIGDTMTEEMKEKDIEMRMMKEIQTGKEKDKQ